MSVYKVNLSQTICLILSREKKTKSPNMQRNAFTFIINAFAFKVKGINTSHYKAELEYSTETIGNIST